MVINSLYDGRTPTKPSQLDPELVGKLLVNLDSQVNSLKSGDGAVDIESLLAFQRAANYL